MLARHLPPSADLPRVLALDTDAAGELKAAAHVTGPDQAQGAGGPYDAIAGSLPPEPEALGRLWRQLRPGGRVILTAAAGEPQALLQALVAAGFIHCLIEPAGARTLYRGERPPAGSSLERQKRLAGAGLSEAVQPEAAQRETPQRGISEAALPRYLFLLITQTPNKPVWKLQPGDAVEWHAATLLDADGRPRLAAFSSLPKAVAFMQNAILARMLSGVNKVGKFPASAAQAWPVPLLLNPDFEAVAGAPVGPPLRVEPHAAVGGEE